MSMAPVSTPSSRSAAPTRRSVPSLPWVRSIASPRRLGTYVRAVMPPTTPITANLFPRLRSMRGGAEGAAVIPAGGEARGVGALEVDERDREHAVDRQRVAADLADHPRGGAERGQRRSRAGDDERARALAEEVVEAGDRRAEAGGDRALGQRDRDAALGDVVGGADRARADGLADRGVQRLDLAELDARERALDGLAAQLGELRRGVRGRPAGGRPARSRRRAGPTRAGPRGPRPAARRRGRRPASGRSGLRRPRCRARRCRRRPGCRTRGTRRRGRRWRA